jgi:hypothetical protein
MYKHPFDEHHMADMYVSLVRTTVRPRDGGNSHELEKEKKREKEAENDGGRKLKKKKREITIKH